jgi:hypothetical protein
METGQQKHRNKHKCRRRQRKVYCFRYDIGKNTVVCHDRLLEVVDSDGVSAHMGLGVEFARIQARIYFPRTIIGVSHANDGRVLLPAEDRASA